jgi:hypothetical protein
VPVALPPKPVVAPVKAIGITGAAFGQTKPPNVFEYATSPVSIVVVPIAPTVRDTSGAPVSMGATSVSPNWKPVALKPAPLPAPERTPDVVVINYGKGGRVDEHKQRFADYRLTKTRVELRGPCYSACTLLLTYVEPENLSASRPAHLWRSMPCAGWSAACAWMRTLGGSTSACRRRYGVGSIATAGRKTCRSTATGRCTITNCGRSAIRGARRDPEGQPEMR